MRWLVLAVRLVEDLAQEIVLGPSEVRAGLNLDILGLDLRAPRLSEGGYGSALGFEAARRRETRQLIRSIRALIDAGGSIEQADSMIDAVLGRTR